MRRERRAQDRKWEFTTKNVPQVAPGTEKQQQEKQNAINDAFVLGKNQIRARTASHGVWVREMLVGIKEIKKVK